MCLDNLVLYSRLKLTLIGLYSRVGCYTRGGLIIWDELHVFSSLLLRFGERRCGSAPTVSSSVTGSVHSTAKGRSHVTGEAQSHSQVLCYR